MKYTKKAGAKSTVKFTMKLDPAEWEAAVEKAYQKNKGKYSLPGFRKGKVPRKVLEQTYGAGVFFEEAVNVALPEHYGKILDKETELVVLGSPDVSLKDMNDKGVTFEIVAPVKPEVKLGAYTGMKIEKVAYNVTAEEEKAAVEREENAIKERNATYEDVTDRAAEEGDTANIDYSGSVDGKKFEGGTSKGYDLTLGSHSFIPGFEEGVVGMKAGEEKDIQVKFPEEYHAKELAGKDAVFAVKVNALKKKVVPELTDELVKDGSEYATVKELEEGVVKKLKENKEKNAKIEEENKIIDQVTAATEVEIPDILVERQIDNMVRDMEYRMMYSGIKLEDYLKYSGTTMEDLRNNYRENAEKQVKSQLVVDAILEKEGIKATEEDVDAKLAELAKDAGKSPEEFKKTVSDYQKEYVEREIVIGKLFDFLRKNNEIA